MTQKAEILVADIDQDRRAVEGVVRRMHDDFLKRRTEGREERFYDDCTIWDVFEPNLIVGKTERETFHVRDKSQSVARGSLALEVRDILTTVHADIAIARYYLDFAYQSPNAVAGVIRITCIMQRRGSSWQIIHHHEGMVPAGVPPFDE